MANEIIIYVSSKADVKGLLGAEMAADKLVKSLSQYPDVADEINKTPMRVKIEATKGGNVRIAEITEQINDLNDADTRRLKIISKTASVEKDSLISKRQLLSVLTQQKNSVKAGTEAFRELDGALKRVKLEVLEAQGVQNGSIAQIEAINSQYRQQQRELNNTAETYNNLQDKIRENEQAIRTLQGVQKGSRTDLVATIRLLEQQRDAINPATDRGRFDDLSKEIDGLKGELAGLDGPLKNFNKIVDGVARLRVVFDSLNGAIRIINGTISIFVNRLKQIEAFQLALQNVGFAASRANVALQKSSDIALKLGAPLQSVEQSYRRMIPSLVSLGIESNKSDAFIESLTARTQILGLNSEQTGRYVEAFAQVLAKGKLSGEELNQQISELDGKLRSDLAQSLGISTTKFVELVEAGQIGANTFVDAFIKSANGADVLAANVENGTATIQQLQNILGTINTKNIEVLSLQFESLFKAVLQTQVAFAKLVSVLINSPVFILIAGIVRDLVEGFLSYQRATLGLVTSLINLLRPLNDVLFKLEELTGIASGVAKAVGVLFGLLLTSSALFLFAKGLGALKGAFAALGGGIIIKAITSLQIFSQVVTAINLNGLIAGLRLLGAAFLNFAILKIGNLFLGIIKGGGSFLGIIFKIVAALGLLKTALIVVGIATGIQLIRSLVAGREGFRRATEATDVATKALENFNKTYNTSNLKPPTLLGKSTKSFEGFFKALSNQAGLKSYNEFIRGLQKADPIFRAFQKEINKSGGELKTFNDLQKINSQDIVKNQAAQDGLLTSSKARLSVIEAQIALMEKENPGMTQQINNLKKMAETTKAEINLRQANIKALDEEIERRILNGEKIGSNEQRIQALDAAISKMVRQQKDLDVSIQAKTYKELANNIITAEQAQAKNAVSTIISNKSLIQAYRIQLQTLEERRVTNGKLNAEEQLKVDELNSKILQATAEEAQAYGQLKQAITDAFTKGIQDAQRLADVAITAAGNIKSAFDSISQTAVSGIQAGLSVISAISSAIQADADRALQASIADLEAVGLQGIDFEIAKAKLQAEADAKKKAALETELRLRSQMSNIEFEIESIRIEVAKRVAITEARIAQQRLAAEAAIAKARGQDDLAQALTNAAQLQNQVIRGIQIEADLNQKILSFKRDQERVAIATAAADAGIQGFANLDLGSSIGQLQQFAGQARSAVNEFANLTDGTFELGRNIDSTAVQKGQEEADKIKESIDAAAAAATSMSDNFKAAAESMSSITDNSFTLLRNIEAMNAFAFNARATGGPVTAGSQYTINDGGGREAFLNKFGRMSMLPAGRNLQWTAPTSGLVIPANLVSDYMANVRAKQISTLSTRNQFNNGVSGNLITHVSTSSSRNSSSANSRIVNNVTIQSQNPVADASMLMTQIQKIKSRRRR